MAQDIFVKINGIDGESQDASHLNEIEAIGWRWRVSLNPPMHAGSGGGEICYEQVRLSFARMKHEYILQNSLGGNAGTVTALLDLKANQGA